MKVSAIDIGNSSIKLSFIEAGKITFFRRVNDGELNTLINFAASDAIVISSVNPAKARTIYSYFNKKFKGTLLSLDSKSKYSFGNSYRNRQSLGVDRLCGAEGAYFLEAERESKPDVIITADFGTATTINVVEEQTFIGGYIIPGARLSFKALNQNTAFLPKVDKKFGFEEIGRDTLNCMLSGVILAGVSLLERTFIAYQTKYSTVPSVYVTGGNADYFLAHIKHPYTFVKELTAIGMYSVAAKMIEKN